MAAADATASRVLSESRAAMTRPATTTAARPTARATPRTQGSCVPSPSTASDPSAGSWLSAPAETATVAASKARLRLLDTGLLARIRHVALLGRRGRGAAAQGERVGPLEDRPQLPEVPDLVDGLRLSFFLLVAAAALHLDGDHAESVRRVHIRARPVADVDAARRLQVEVAARAPVELGVRLVDPDLVRDEDRRRRHEVVDAEAHELLRLLDHETARDDPPHQVRDARQRAQELDRVRVGRQLAHLRVVIGDDSGRDDDGGVDSLEVALRDPAQELVEVVVVVRGELGHDLVELLEEDVALDLEPDLDHGVHARLARLLGELRGREQRVVHVEEDRVEQGVRHGRSSPGERPKDALPGPVRSVYTPGVGCPGISYLVLKRFFSSSRRTTMRAVTRMTRLSVSRSSASRLKMTLRSGTSSTKGVPERCSFSLNSRKPPTRTVPPSGTMTDV